jgi:hypothetical protein
MIDWACNLDGGGKKCIQNVDREISEKMASWRTKKK